MGGLLKFLQVSKLNDLARVPLLSLFFCLLWMKEKETLVELAKRKAKLYQAIVKHILQHSHRRHSSFTASKLKETDYENILAVIGTGWLWQVFSKAIWCSNLVNCLKRYVAKRVSLLAG